MAAIIKNNFRVQNARDFLENLVSHPRTILSTPDQSLNDINNGRLTVTSLTNSTASAKYEWSWQPASNVTPLSSDQDKRVDAVRGLKIDIGAHLTDRNHYLFIGRSLPWTEASAPRSMPELSPAPPRDTHTEEARVWEEMLSLKKITEMFGSLVIPRIDWDATGQTVYEKFDDNPPSGGSLNQRYLPATNSGVSNEAYDMYRRRKFYVLTDDYDLFICLENNNGGVSQIKPVRQLNPADLVEYTDSTQDGYVWKYVTTIKPTDVKKFLTDAWVPVKTLGDIPNDGSDQWLVEQHAKQNPGTVLSFHVESAGSNYTTAPTVTVTTNGGTAVQAQAILNDTGGIKRIKITNPGKGATFASATITGGGGTGATIRPILSPTKGLCFDVEKDLGAHFVMLNAYIKYEDGDGDFPANNDFRQLGIIRNVRRKDGSLATETTLIATKSVVVENVSLDPQKAMYFQPDEVINSGNVSAIVLEYVPDSPTPGKGTIKYIQTPATGYNPITKGLLQLTGSVSGATCNVVNSDSAIISEEILKHEGEMLYLENRRPVLRSPEQVEDIKAIIEF